MDTKEAQEMMRRVYFRRDKARGVERTLLRTFHELGELSDAILREKDHETISDEVADVFAWLCSLANLLDIDLSEALIQKYNNACSRCGEAPCVCTDSP
ncbi:MAG: MazG nucleotide pyrophosphohydrolase domain-containing protein [Candidatus Thorarchaeota archaeon]